MWLDLQVQRRLQAAGQDFVLDVSLQCTQRQVVLFGPSGAGKSLTLKAVAGLLRPGQGHVRLQGQTLFDAATAVDLPPQRRRLGYVFQDYALFPHLSVRQNVAFGLQKGWLNPRVGQRFDAVEQWLHASRTDTVGDLLPAQVSGGQRQRTALARALVTQPQALLLDEPFSALDKNLRLSMQVELKAIQRKLGVTTVFVTHDQGEALSMSDRVVVMSAGHVRQIGPPDEIYRRPQDPFVASFVGDVNILPGRYAGRDTSALLELGGNTLRLPAKRVQASIGDRLDVYVRPENVQLAPLGPQALLSATVLTHVFQGDHVDVHLDIPALGSASLFARQSGLDALTRWPVGSVVGLTFDDEGVCAFASDAQG